MCSRLSLLMSFLLPCPNMYAQTIINCLNDLQSLRGVPSYMHSGNASYFKSREIKNYFTSRGVAASRCSLYYPFGYSQVGRYNGIIWHAVRLTLKTRKLPIERWESVLSEVLHSQRSLLCKATNATPREMFFNFYRKLCCGFSLPRWLSEPGPVLLRNYVRTHKNDALV